MKKASVSISRSHVGCKKVVTVKASAGTFTKSVKAPVKTR